jgi:hypothetical protein
MRKLLLLLSIIFFANGISHSQCNTYYDFREGTEFEVESFNAKDRKQGRSVSRVTSYSESGNGFEAVIQSTIFDNKNKEAHKGDYSMNCNNGLIFIDMKKFVPEESLKAMEGAELEIKGDLLELPTRLAVGQTLKDGTIEMKMSTQQAIGMSTTITITDRKVEAKETITTPAGQFECFKITYTINARTNMMGINMNNVMKAAEWVSEGVGVVKTSSFNARGALTGYTLLSRYEK